MKIITLSEKQIKTSTIYNAIKEKHIVISITSAANQELMLPNNINRVSQLFLKFDDVQDIDSRVIYFDQSMADDILTFVEKHLTSISLIVVQCQAGLSRSVAIGAALSKILNYADDAIFTKGLPNMFVYTTLLDYFFGNRYWKNEFPKIAHHRLKSMSYYLDAATVRLAQTIETKRGKNEDIF